MRFYREGQFSRETSLGYLIRRAHQLGQAALEPIYAAEGLTGTQWSVLMLALDGENATCAALARDLAYDKGAMTRLIDQLVERGLILRDRCGDDRRVNNLSLTDAGRELTYRTKRRIYERWNDWLEDWEQGDVETLIALLRRLDTTLEKAEADGC